LKIFVFIKLLCLGLGDSIADIRALYQAKQAVGKLKRVTYDETKHRDEVDMSNQIRSFPMAASKSPERQINDSPSVIKKGKIFL
jgi:hypothetical protein